MTVKCSLFPRVTPKDALGKQLEEVVISVILLCRLVCLSGGRTPPHV